MSEDRSEGWEAVAEVFMASRSRIGADVVQAWAREVLPPGAEIVDVACGSGVPISQALIDAGFKVSGIDASPTLIAAFHHRFPDAPFACETAQDSVFFHRRFDAVVSVGLLFLLNEADQRTAIGRMAGAVRPGGRLLFTAPRQVLEWEDVLTNRRSRSLGLAAYEDILRACGLHLAGCRTDEGGNHYYDAVNAPA